MHSSGKGEKEKATTGQLSLPLGFANGLSFMWDRKALWKLV